MNANLLDRVIGWFSPERALHRIEARASLQQVPGPRSPYRILLDAVQAVLDSGAVVAREGYGLEEIAYGIWALVHGMATLQQTHLRQHEANFAAVDRHVLEAFVQGLAVP